MDASIARFKGYVIDGQFFPTKLAVERKIQGILYAYPLGAKVNAVDAQFLLAVLEGHPEAEQKIGCGIAAFEVRKNPRFTGRRGFFLIRVDGSEDDFSFMKCLYPPSPLLVFKAVCRRLIGRELFMFKVIYFSKHQNEHKQIQCPVAGDWITRDQAHVDHIPPITFERIVLDFIGLYNIQVDTVDLCDTEGEDEIGKTFKDTALIDAWRSYHNEHARLRVVSAYANLSIIKRLA